MKTINEIFDHNQHDIQMDSQARADKEKILSGQRANARLYSVAETFQFIAAALLPVGLGTVIAIAKEQVAATAAASAASGASTAAGIAGEITLASIATAFTATPALVLLGAAALCTAVAIGSRFMASKHYHNANFNSTEINAQHTAKYIAKELKEQAACVAPEYLENSRADGKQWTQIVQPKEANQSVTMART